MHALSFHAGPKALAQLHQHGLRAADVAIVPAAAGGPKGLIFQSLDQWLFGHWLPSAPRQRSLIGASIGAWRMAAACHADPAAAIARFGALYCAQRYATVKPSPQEIDAVCQSMLAEFMGGHEHEIVGHLQHRLHMLTARGRHLLHRPRHRAAALGGFACAALANLGSRAGLAQMLERVVVGDARDALAWLREPFDAFHTHFTPLTKSNLAPALLASGTLPMLMDPVQAIAGAPAGSYWDGGLIDYHLALPYARLPDPQRGALVLYPHFSEHIVPGWLDKGMPWRRAARGPQRAWLDNMLIVAPSAAFLQTLERARLPERADFQLYGMDQLGRARSWQNSIAQGERLRDELAAFVERPDLNRVVPI